MGFYLTDAGERVEKKNPITRARRGMRNPDGWNIIAETSTAGYTNFYTWGVDASGTLNGADGVGGLLSMTRITGGTTNTSYYCADGNYNITDMVDANGNIVAHYEYGPFGETLVAIGPMAAINPWRFSTRYYDTETGLIMFPERPYSPTLGRFLCKDMLGEQEGGINLYAITENDPIGRIDPSGLSWWNPFSWFGAKPCCNNTAYDSGKSCCCKDCKDQPGATGADLLDRKEIDVGVKRCTLRGRYHVPGLLQHAWLEGSEVPNGSAGFYPEPLGHPITKPGKVHSYDPDVGKGSCDPIKLSPCEYDIPKFKACIKREVNNGLTHPPNYYVGAYDCKSWREDVIGTCLKETKGKCAQP